MESAEAKASGICPDARALEEDNTVEAAPELGLAKPNECNKVEDGATP